MTALGRAGVQLSGASQWPNLPQGSVVPETPAVTSARYVFQVTCHDYLETDGQDIRELDDAFSFWHNTICFRRTTLPEPGVPWSYCRWPALDPLPHGDAGVVP